VIDTDDIGIGQIHPIRHFHQVVDDVMFAWYFDCIGKQLHISRYDAKNYFPILMEVFE
jgi:hypothetical protein